VISGLGGKGFEDAVGSIEDIHQLLAENISEDMKLELTALTTWQGHKSIQIDNRYLTSRRFMPPGAQPVLLDPTVDPTGRLGSLIGQEWSYTEENRVLYFEKKQLVNGAK
jgi:hypothetical protein